MYNNRKAVSLLMAMALLMAVCTGAMAATLNAYTVMPEKYASKVFEQFTKDTGIKVNFIRFSSGEALARLVAERNNPQVDILLGGPADIYTAGQKDNVFAVYVQKDQKLTPAEYRDPGNHWTGIGLIPLCFLTNTDFLKKNSLKAPESWQDLLNPAYKNGLQMADARTSGTATERIYSLIGVYGVDGAFDYQKKLHKNVQLYTKSGAGGAMPIAQGQASSGIFYLVDALDIQQQGYPVIITYPKEGVTFGIEATGMIAGAKNQEEAKKFIDWATSPKLGQFFVDQKINYIPVVKGVKITSPALDMSKVKLLKVGAEHKGDKRKAYVERWINEVIR